MKKYKYTFYKIVKTVVISCTIIAILGGCSIYMPENTESPEGSVTMTESVILPTDKVEETSAPETATPIVPTQTDSPSANASKWIERYENSGNDKDAVLLSNEDIAAFNKNVADRSGSVVLNILHYPDSVSHIDIKSDIEAMSVPSLPKYDKEDNAITQSQLEEILLNRNLSVLSDEENSFVKLGIVVQRTAIRSLPTEVPFFSDPGTQYYDRIQETEIIVGSGVWVLHESTDGEYLFVRTFNYSGWVASEHIAFASSADEWESFVNPQKFAVVKDALYTTKDSYTKLDMGVKLPLADMSAEGYKVKVPGRNPDGSLYYDFVVLGGDIACEGYLPFTMNNFYKQAFKYEGFMYGWGGSYDSVDCSGFVSAVMRVFGFVLPRNVSQQRTAVGEIILVEGSGKDNIDSVLDGVNIPAVVYKPGHVMLYLGKYDGAHYVIHSPTGGRVVCEEILDTSSTSIVSINKFN